MVDKTKRFDSFKLDINDCLIYQRLGTRIIGNKNFVFFSRRFGGWPGRTADVCAAGSGVEGPVLRARPDSGGKFFTRPYIPRPPRLVHKVGGGWGGSRPQKGQNTAYSGRPLYVGQCRESPCLPVTEYAQRI